MLGKKSIYKNKNKCNCSFFIDAGGSLTSPPATPNPALKQDGLMHLNDLVVKPSDLDHIFESDSDNDDSVRKLSIYGYTKIRSCGMIANAMRQLFSVVQLKWM